MNLAFISDQSYPMDSLALNIWWVESQTNVRLQFNTTYQFSISVNLFTYTFGLLSLS